MRSRLPATHAVLLGLVMAATAFVLWSSTQASTKLQNLVVLVPVSAVLVLSCTAIVAIALRQRSDPIMSEAKKSEETSAETSIWGDVVLLAGFGLFCLLLTRVGFDLATFIFVWAGVVLSGGRGLWQPPLFAAIFTVALVYGFGSLFPYPMETMVL